MPVHDWSKVTAGTFHHFHQGWITALSDALNDGLLPEGYYALAEQVAGRPHPDVLALEEFGPPADGWETGKGSDAGVALAVHPPKVRYTLEAEETLYAAKANGIAIYHTSGDRVVAFVEIVSPGNKRSQVAVNQLVEELATALQQGRHLLVIDLHPPGKHDPDGLHAAFWGATPGVTGDQPLSLAAYRSDTRHPDIPLENSAFFRFFGNSCRANWILNSGGAFRKSAGSPGSHGWRNETNSRCNWILCRRWGCSANRLVRCRVAGGGAGVNRFRRGGARR